MSNRDIGLELKLADRQQKLEKLKKRLQVINQKIAEGVDFEEEEKLEARKDGIFQEMSLLEAEIKSIKSAIQVGSIEKQDHELLTILQSDSLQQQIQQAYQATVSRWPTPTPLTTSSPSEMLRELTRLGRNQEDYSAVESFIAHLWHTASEPLLSNLGQWGQSYYPERNWTDLYHTIQTQISERAKRFRPAIFVKISPAEERSTQSAHNQPYYRLEAWLIEDIDTYQTKGKRRKGFKPLIKAETPAAEPFSLEALEEKMQPLLGQWLKRTKQLLMDCERDPEFYVFLPKELLDTAVDQWPLTARGCLGYTYPVVLCCSDRIDYPTTSISGWRQYWERHENAAGRIARDVFIECDGSDMAAVMAAIATITASDDVVGLHLTNAPSAETLDLIAEELWMVGLPLMLWGRCNELKINNAQALDTILQKKSLDELAETLKTERLQSRSNTPECHIGHHLSLLRDNPLLIYPLSA